MSACVRGGCGRPEVAPWWRLCVDCTAPLLDAGDAAGSASADQALAAGWDALEWAERISPWAWGNADESDRWVLAVRCQVMASVVTGRASGCAHTVAPTAAAPVVAVARMPEVFRCPQCAESLVARSGVMGPACDRCQGVPVLPVERVAAVAGSSLIIVGQLCRPCHRQVLELMDGVGPV